MLRIIINSILGILAAVAGFYVIYLYLKSLRETGQPLLLLLAFPLIISGIILLIRTSRSDESLVISTFQEAPATEAVSSVPAGTGNIMEKNNQLLNDWIKESEKRDKMKILEIAASAQEENDKNAKTGL